MRANVIKGDDLWASLRAIGPRLCALPVLLAVLPPANVPEVVVVNTRNIIIFSGPSVLVAIGPRPCALPVLLAVLKLANIPEGGLF